MGVLGEKLAGVVCDDESNETVASTVVNCMKIDEGKESFVFTPANVIVI